ncbi:hypothetical protein ES703_104334 [subsurface metagenome]
MEIEYYKKRHQCIIRDGELSYLFFVRPSDDPNDEGWRLFLPAPLVGNGPEVYLMSKSCPASLEAYVKNNIEKLKKYALKYENIPLENTK